MTRADVRRRGIFLRDEGGGGGDEGRGWLAERGCGGGGGGGESAEVTVAEAGERGAARRGEARFTVRRWARTRPKAHQKLSKIKCKI